MRRWAAALGAFLVVTGGARTLAEEGAAPPPAQAPSAAPPADVEPTVVEVTAPREPAAPARPAPAATVGPLGERPLREVPFAVDVLPGGFLEGLQPAASGEATRYSTPVTSATGGSRVTDYNAIRGFTSSVWTGNVSLDGLRTWDVTVPLEDKERVQVLSGVTGFLYGVTSPGGMIDYVSKRPTAERRWALTLGNHGGGQWYGHADLGGPLGPGDALRYRLNVAHVAGGDTGVEHQTNERTLVSGSLAWRPAAHTELLLDLSWYRRELEYAQALFMIGKATRAPSPIDGARNWGAPYAGAGDLLRRAGLELRQELGEAVTLRAAVRVSDVARSVVTYRQYWVNDAFDHQAWVNMQARYHTLPLQGRLALEARLRTGSVAHRLTASWTEEQVANRYPVGGTVNVNGTDVYPGNLGASDPGHAPEPAAAVATGPLRTTQRTRVRTALLLDQVALLPRLSLIGAVAWAAVRDQSWALADDKAGPVYSRGRITPSAAALFDAGLGVSTYASYAEGLQQGFVAPSTAANAGQVFSPYVSRQWELGARAPLFGLELSAALFRTEQPSQLVDGTTYTQDGRERHQGLELSWRGSPLRQVTMLGGVTWLDARVTRTATAAADHKRPQGVPEKTAKLAVDWETPVPGLAGNAGVVYTDRQWVDAANAIRVPALTTVDLGLRYRLPVRAVRWSVLVNGSNVFDARGWSTRAGLLYPASPRTFAFATRAEY